jgi:hypothetical protein
MSERFWTKGLFTFKPFQIFDMKVPRSLKPCQTPIPTRLSPHAMLLNFMHLPTPHIIFFVLWSLELITSVWANVIESSLTFQFYYQLLLLFLFNKSMPLLCQPRIQIFFTIIIWLSSMTYSSRSGLMTPSLGWVLSSESWHIKGSP